MKISPDYIQFYPTVRCNQTCEFCFNHSLPNLPDMDFEDFQKMIHTLRKSGVRGLDVMGGEPAVHPDIFRLLRFAQQAGMDVNLSSNGSDADLLARIMTDHPGINVGVSINNRETAEDLKIFLAKYHPIVKTVAARPVDKDLIDFLLSSNPRKFYLLFCDAMQPAQLGQTMSFDRFLHLVHTQFDHKCVDTVFCSGFLPDVEKYPALQSVRCPAGTTKLAVLPDGSVYPCNLFFGVKDMLLGNILTDPLERIWGQPALSFFRTFIENTCPRNTCELHALCRGGCPAHSLIHFGKRSAPDPRCVN